VLHGVLFPYREEKGGLPLTFAIPYISYIAIEFNACSVCSAFDAAFAKYFGLLLFLTVQTCIIGSASLDIKVDSELRI